jgi:hypothetical protein
MSTENDPIRKATSDRRLAAFREDYRMSTEPTTREARAASRLNAVKHGLYAETVAIPGEDGTVFDARFNAWSRDLNPSGSACADYLVSLIVRKSIRLDGGGSVDESTIGDLVRAVFVLNREGKKR